MYKTRIILFVIFLALVALFFTLPKVVVDDEGETVKVSENQQPNDSNSRSPEKDAAHNPNVLSENTQKQLGFIKEQLYQADNKRKSITFADSLARFYENLAAYDSAAKYRALIVGLDSSSLNLEKAGLAYFDAFSTSFDAEKGALNGEKCRSYLNQVLETNPDRYDLKNKIALTLVSSQTPMQGILMLRQIVVDNPENVEALYNLGILSFQTGQYEKAVERLFKASQLAPDNYQAKYYLAASYQQTGASDKAITVLEEVMKQETDPEVLAASESLMKELRK